MALILAIEPDERQAAQLTDVISRRVSAELVLADSTERALAAIGDRVPDLVLIPMLLSPQEDAALAGALRAIATAGRVQMLTIPVLAETPKPVRKRGVLAQFRRSRTASTPDGCDPSVFGDQIAAYLAEAALARRQDAPVDDLATVAAAASETALTRLTAAPGEPIAMPGVEPVAVSVDEPVAVPAIDPAASLAEPIPAPVVYPAEIPVFEPVVMPAAAPLVMPRDDGFTEPVGDITLSLGDPIAIVTDDPIVTTADALIAIAEPPAQLAEAPIAAVIDDLPAVVSDEPVMMAAEASIVVQIDESLSEAIEESDASTIVEPASINDYDPIAIRILNWARTPIEDPLVGIEEPITFAEESPVSEEPAVYDLSFDEWAGDAASMMTMGAMMPPADETRIVAPVAENPALDAALTVAMPEPSNESEVVVMESLLAATEPVVAVSEPLIAVAAEPVAAVCEPVSAASERDSDVTQLSVVTGAEPMGDVIEPTVAAETIALVIDLPVFPAAPESIAAVIEPPVVAAAVEPILAVVEPTVLPAPETIAVLTDLPMVAAAAESKAAVIEPPVVAAAVEHNAIVEPQMPVPAEPVFVVTQRPGLAAIETAAAVTTPSMPAVAAPPLAPLSMVASTAATLDDDPGFFGGSTPEAPAKTPAPPAAPAKPKRHEWIELVESLRLDLERRRVEREAMEAAAQEKPGATTPVAAPRRVAPPQPARRVRRLNALRSPSRKNKPVQNEWGLFDPEQCGFAALLAKLDEITQAK